MRASQPAAGRRGAWPPPRAGARAAAGGPPPEPPGPPPPGPPPPSRARRPRPTPSARPRGPSRCALCRSSARRRRPAGRAPRDHEPRRARPRARRPGAQRRARRAGRATATTRGTAIKRAQPGLPVRGAVEQRVGPAGARGDRERGRSARAAGRVAVRPQQRTADRDERGDRRREGHGVVGVDHALS